jgi:hypothetical protein
LIGRKLLRNGLAGVQGMLFCNIYCSMSQTCVGGLFFCVRMKLDGCNIIIPIFATYYMLVSVASQMQIVSMINLYDVFFGVLVTTASIVGGRCQIGILG